MARSTPALAVSILMILTSACSPSGAGTTVALHVDAPTALIDRPLEISVRGVTPGQAVEIRAQMRDEAHQLWESSARFVADRQGLVDLTRQSPRSGSYGGVDGMGLFWSLRPAHDPKPQGTSVYNTTMAAWIVRLSALVAGTEVASQTVKRLRVGPGLRYRVLQQSGLYGGLYTALDGSRRRPVIVLGGSEGSAPVAWAALLASHGMSALALAYFKAPGLPVQLADIPLEYFVRARDWLVSQPDVQPGQVALVGVSRGAELALLLAATFPQSFQSVVAYAPSSEVYPGAGSIGPPAWTLNGRPVSWLPNPSGKAMFRDGVYVLRPAFESSLDDAPAAAAAVIPVEKIAGPLMLISGTDDQVWPSDRYADLIQQRRQAAGVPYADQNLKYQEAGHLIGPPYRPTNVTQLSGLALGGTPQAYALADADSWPRVLSFLGTQ